MAEQPENLTVDVVVIGGGLAGLVAAASALNSGASAVLIDGHSVGGRARSVERSGYTLNEGGHALYRKGSAVRVLNELGLALDGGPPSFENAQLVWDGALVPFPYTATRMARSKLLGVKSKVAAAKLFSLFENPPDVAPDLSFGDWLTERKTPADLRKLILALARLGTYAAAPETWSAPIIIRQLGLSRGGVIYIDGGWQSLVTQLAEVVTKAGGRVIEDDVVTGMSQDGATWRVSTSRNVVTARSVVLAAGSPAVAAGLLGDDPGWTAAAGPAVRASCLDLAFDHVPPAMFVLGADAPLYLSRHAPAARLAPAGHSLYSMMRYLSPTDDYSADQNRAALKQHAAIAGLHETPTLERFLAAPVVCWGSPLATCQRPTGCEAADRGVFAAGDWLGGNLLADASVASGRAAGRAAAEHAARKS